jgi:hypothetical protein
VLNFDGFILVLRKIAEIMYNDNNEIEAENDFKLEKLLKFLEIDDRIRVNFLLQL